MSFIINPYIYGSPLCADADGNAFLTATGITNPTIASAICTLVTSMKANGTWAKMSAIYPFVGGTATTHKFNLKNPADTNAAFRLSFVGGVTHTSNGVQGNGVNGYANTNYLLTNFAQNNVSFGIYSRSNIQSGASGADNGSYIGVVLYIRNTDSFTYYSTNNNILNGHGIIVFDMRGLYVSNRLTSTNSLLYRNGILLRNATSNSVAPTLALNMALMARNLNGSIREYDSRQYSFAFMGQGLTPTENLNLYNTIQTFQTTLGRQV
jgi:hypothetical protein